MRETATDQEVGVAPLLRTTEDENRPVLRDDRGRWLPGTRPGPGRHPLVTAREDFRREAAKAFTPEIHREAIEGFIEQVLAQKPWAVKAYLQLFGDGRAGGGAGIFQGQNVTIKVVQGVQEDAL